MIKQIPEDFQVEEVLKLKLQKKGNYSYFILTKKDWATFKIIEKIASLLRIKPKLIGFAGNKDKQAISKQYISIYKIPKEKVERVRINDISLKFIGYGAERINLGYLTGNNFKIVVRKLKENFKINPVPIENYFDEQRFGKFKNTHLVGKAIIKKDFKEACSLLNLEVSNNDYIGALRTQNRRLLRFYISSFQSYLFNKALATYLRQFSHRTLGDFIFIDEKIKNFKLPLISFDAKLKGEIGEIYTKVLKEEGITPEDFIIKPIPELIQETSYRNAFVEVKNLKYYFSKDELNKGYIKLTIEFELPKSAYATMVIKKYINEDAP